MFEWVREIADGAAKMSRTKVAVKIDTDCHEIIPNHPLMKVLHRNLTRVGPAKFTDADRALAKELQAPLRGEFGLKEERPLHDVIDELPATPPPVGGLGPWGMGSPRGGSRDHYPCDRNRPRTRNSGHY